MKLIPEMTARDIARFWAKVDVRGPDECWPWKGSTKYKGYGKFKLGAESIVASRVALKVAGVIQTGPFALHSCDNPPCVNPAHLHWGNNAENTAERDARGRHTALRGASNGNSRLTEDDVRAIRASAEMLKDLRARYGVSLVTLVQIRKRRTWAHVD